MITRQVQAVLLQMVIPSPFGGGNEQQKSTYQQQDLNVEVTTAARLHHSELCLIHHMMLPVIIQHVPVIVPVRYNTQLSLEPKADIYGIQCEKKITELTQATVTAPPPLQIPQ